MDIQIYVVTHKSFNKPKSDIYIPIIAGAEECPENLFPNYLLDNTGDNISSKHWLYSEFTVIYWIWKNCSSEIVGENHYRRYFINGSWIEYIKLQFSRKLDNECAIKKSELEEIFNEGYTCVVPKKQAHFEKNMYQFYLDARKDGEFLFKSLEEIISRKYPEYTVDYHNMLKQKINHFKCISIMRKDKFDNLASWLFGIFDEMEKLDFSFKEREFAFMGEWLENVWLMHNERTGFIKIKELFYINTECTIGQFTYINHETIWPLWIKRIDYIFHITRIIKGVKKIINFILRRIR